MLSLDGGGTRGIISAVILKKIEEMTKQRVIKIVLCNLCP